MKPWEKYQGQSGPWQQFQAAPTLENAIASTPEVGALAVPAPTQRPASTRFRDAFMESLTSVPRGAQQLAIQATGTPEEVAANQAEIDAERSLYNRDIATAPGFLGSVAGSMVGGGAALGLLGRLPRIGRAAQSAVLPTSAKRAAAIGAGVGGLQPVASDESRALNALTGGAGGAAGYGLGRGLQGAVDRLSGGRISQAAQRQAELGVSDQAAIDAARSAVPGFDEMTPNVQQSVIRYVRQALSTDGQASPAEAGRHALVEGLPVPIRQLTRGQRTQNYAQQDTEGVLANTDAGAELRNLRQNQRDLLAQNMDVITRPLGPGVPAAQFGQQVRSDISAQRDAAAAGVRDLYRQAEQQAGGKIVKPDALVDFFNANEGMEGVAELLTRARALKLVSTDANGGLIANNVPMARLNDFRRSTTVLGGSADGSKRHFAGQAKGAVDDLVLREGGDAYKKATAARRQMGEDFDNNRGAGDILRRKGGRFGQDPAVADENVFAHLTSGSTQDVRNFMKVASPESKKVLAANLGQHLKEKMVGETNGQTTLSLLQLEREMQRIGDDKLKLILGDTTVAQLKQVVAAASVIERRAPDLAGGSQTATRLANLGQMGWNLLERVSAAVPVVGPIAAAGTRNFVKGAVDSAAVRKATQPFANQLSQSVGARSPASRTLNTLAAFGGGAALPGYLNNSPDEPE